MVNAPARVAAENKVKVSPTANTPPVAVTLSVPPSVRVVTPCTLLHVRVVPVLFNCIAVVPLKTRVLLTVRVPIPLLPGARVPLLATGPLMVPVPPSVPVAATDTALPATSEPFTSKVPLLTVVGPV